MVHEFSLDTKIIEHTREVYHVLDYIGDVGGLFDGILYIFHAVMAIFSVFGYSPLEAYLVNVSSKDSNDVTIVAGKAPIV